MHSKAAGKEYGKGGMNEDAATDGGHTEVHNHGDGTFHTVHGGQEEPHETIGHLHAHLSKLHGEEGHSHFHAHHDGEKHTSHHVAGGGEPEHREHEDLDGVHQHLAEAMGGEEESPAEDRAEGEEEPAGKGLGGLY